MSYHADYFQPSASASASASANVSISRQSDAPWSIRGSLILVLVASAALWAVLFSCARYLIG